jgi:hypothetical protein
MRHDLPVVLIGVVRFVGIGVALLGAFVTAPAGSQRLARDLLNTARRVGRTILRHLPWYHHSVSVHVPSIHGTAAMGLPTVTISASASVWSPNAPVAEQIERLRLRTDRLATELERLRDDHRKEVQDLRQQIEALQADHEHALAALRAELEGRERLAAQIDATGLPLIGLGIVLSGWPDRWLPTWWAAFLLFLALVVVVQVILKRRSAR